MRIYQVSYSGDGDGHKGYDYTANYKEAQSKKNAWDKEAEYHNANITPIEVDLSGKGVLIALNNYGGPL